MLSPTAGTRFWFKAAKSFTITGLDCIVKGAATTITLDVLECTSAGASCATTLSSAVTCDDNKASATLGANVSIDAGDWVQATLGTPSGSVTPTQYIRSVMNQVKSKKLRNALFINVAKGIENQSLMRVSEILLDVVPLLTLERIVTLSGPSFAHEVSRQMPTAVVAASISKDAAKQTQNLFITPYFRVYSSDDIKGVELAGALKHVIAIGAGIADGAGFGDNTKAAIMTRATAEISRLGKLIGARQETFAGLSGIGDLIATCVSKHSRNRYVGDEIGKGRHVGSAHAPVAAQ